VPVHGTGSRPPYLRREIRNKLNSRLAALLGGKKGAKKSKKPEAGDKEALRLFPIGAQLRGMNKGAIYKARLRKDGTVILGGKVYPSLSKAGSAAIGRPVNGWWFWTVERGTGNWVRLVEIRRAGTPLI
jgi:hypothetical protein